MVVGPLSALPRTGVMSVDLAGRVSMSSAGAAGHPLASFCCCSVSFAAASALRRRRLAILEGCCSVISR